MDDKLKKLGRSAANASGFPLQIRLADVVKFSHNWNVLVEEHPWFLEDNDSQGFIDLIVIDAEHSIQTFVVECKRVRDTAWVFLVPQKNPRNRSYATFWISNQNQNEDWTHFGWDHRNADPVSYESKFCAVHGSRQGRQTLLERSASDVIDSVEAFAFQEKKGADQQFRRFYVPVIVTTAELMVSFFEPGSISLKDGSLPNDAVFESVPFVRFRKSFGDMSMSFGIKPVPVQKTHLGSERTVFVVNAEHWKTFLDQWEIHGHLIM